jgi:hypothetical protein
LRYYYRTRVTQKASEHPVLHVKTRTISNRSGRGHAFFCEDAFTEEVLGAVLNRSGVVRCRISGDYVGDGCYDFTICGVADSLGGGRVCLLEGGKTYPDFFLPSLGVHVEIKPTEKLSYSDLKRMVEFALEGDHRTDRRLSDTGSHVFDRPLLRAD